MPLGFSIIGSTVTFDLFLRWATQGPLGPLVSILNSITRHWESSIIYPRLTKSHDFYDAGCRQSQSYVDTDLCIWKSWSADIGDIGVSFIAFYWQEIDINEAIKHCSCHRHVSHSNRGLQKGATAFDFAVRLHVQCWIAHILFYVRVENLDNFSHK